MQKINKYYYLVAQLPFLKFYEKTYMNRQYFLEEAAKWLNPRDFKTLSQADLDNFNQRAGDPAVLKEYKNFERSLREELAEKRRIPQGSQEYRKRRVLKADFLEGTPLEVEEKLLRLRWEFIAEKEEGHFFDLEFLLLYFLKLQILERLFTFDKEKGTVVFDALCEVKQ